MKKDVKFSTRMASTDREAIKELAKQSGMSMSDYVTACCLGKQVVVIDGLKELVFIRNTRFINGLPIIQVVQRHLERSNVRIEFRLQLSTVVMSRMVGFGNLLKTAA